MPQERLTVSQWAAKHRRIVSKDTAVPGRWRNELVPYLVEPMDAMGDPDVDEVILEKAARVGGTEAARNWLLWSIDQDPGPFLMVYPTEDAGREQVAKELIPLLQQTPRITQYLTTRPRDLKKNQIELTTCNVYLGWSNSPQSLASRTIRRLMLDEVDKFPMFSGREADPVSLAKRRTTTFKRRRKHVVFSTPTTTLGRIHQEYDSCVDKRQYHVPCPHCDAMQPLVMAQMRWPKPEGVTDRAKLADLVANEQSAWYECTECREKITERHKAQMLNAGAWVRLDTGELSAKPSRRVAYQISALYSLVGESWSEIAAQYLRAQGSVERLMEFVTQVLGEPFQQQTGKVARGALEQKAAKGHPRRVVPRWAGCVLASADTQKGHFYYVVRAWGRGERSRRIDWGIARTFEDLRAATLDARYPIEGWPAESLQPRLLMIDARGGTAAATETDGSRTDEVYRWAQTDPGRILPCAGHGGNARPTKPIRVSRVEYTPPGEKASYGVTLHVLDTQYFADVLAARIAQKPLEDGTETWELCEDGDGDQAYYSHMAGEHKVAIRKGDGVIERWQPVSSGRRVDYLHCERYQLAAAKVARVELLPGDEELELERQRTVKLREKRSMKRGQKGGGALRTPDGRAYLATRR